jgi:hypothetical protein
VKVTVVFMGIGRCGNDETSNVGAGRRFRLGFRYTGEEGKILLLVVFGFWMWRRSGVTG